MASAFHEFSRTYEQFKERFPNHPLVEELRSKIARGRFPSEQWLKIHTRKMKDLIAPFWARSGSTEP